MALRTAILGYGRSGSTLHAHPIETLPDFEMVAVCDIDPERQEQARERFHCPVYDDYEEMLAKEKLDLVSIVTRSDQHCEMTCDCLRAGVNVLVTKPWCVNEAEARCMIQAAEKSGSGLYPWLPARWGTDLLRLKALLAAGAIGNVFYVRRGAYSFGTRSDWQTEKRYGGGYVLNWGPHLVDPPMVLLNARAESVYGRLKHIMNPGDAEDLFFAILNLDNGATVHVEYNIALESLPNWFIQGDRGTIVVRGRDITIHTAAPAAPRDPTQTYTMTSEPTITHEQVGEHIYGDEGLIYSQLAKALRGEASFPVTPDDALFVTRVLDAIKKSDEENRVVNIT